MSTTVFAILYVAEDRRSAQFYADHLGLPILEESPGFAMLALPNGAMLGLWIKGGVQPAVTAAPGGSELALTLPDVAALHARHQEWAAAGVTILSAPMTMDFGTSFTAADPDGHRLRMFVPAM